MMYSTAPTAAAYPTVATVPAGPQAAVGHVQMQPMQMQPAQYDGGGGVDPFDARGADDLEEYDDDDYDDDRYWDYECDPHYLFCEHPYFLQVILAAWWAADIGMSLANYLGWMRESEAKDLYGSGRVNAYLAFVIIAMIVFFTVAGMLWLWAVRRAMDYRDRKRKTLSGIMLLWLFCDLPLWSINYNVIDEFGYREPIQAVAFTAHSFAFAVFGVVSWVTYLMWITNRINETYSRRSTTRGAAGSIHGATKQASDADFSFADNKQVLDSYMDAPATQARQANGWAPGPQAPAPLPLSEFGVAPVYQNQQVFGAQPQVYGAQPASAAGSPAFIGAGGQFAPPPDQALFF
eukprot:Hpha_TRINITY_DN22736_c0_g1::TRINITY_DN22736_c0_g1_i1::g.34140::m.34140